MVNIVRDKIVQKVVGKYFLAKGFLSLQMCTFRIWPLETAIMQGKLRLVYQFFLKRSFKKRYTHLIR